MGAIWDTIQEKRIKFEEGTVACFMEKNNISFSLYAVLEISFCNGSYCGQQILDTSSFLRKSHTGAHAYFLVSLEHQIHIYLNTYIREYLRTNSRKIVVYTENKSKLSSVFKTL